MAEYFSQHLRSNNCARLPFDIFAIIINYLKPPEPESRDYNEKHACHRFDTLDAIFKVSKAFRVLAEPIRWETFYLGAWYDECGGCPWPCDCVDYDRPYIAPGLKWLCSHPNVASQHVRSIKCFDEPQYQALIPLSCIMEAFHLQPFQDFLDATYSSQFCEFLRELFDCARMDQIVDCTAKISLEKYKRMQQNRELALILILTVAQRTERLFYQVDSCEYFDEMPKLIKFVVFCEQSLLSQKQHSNQSPAGAPLQNLRALDLVFSVWSFSTGIESPLLPLVWFSGLEELWLFNFNPDTETPPPTYQTTHYKRVELIGSTVGDRDLKRFLELGGGSLQSLVVREAEYGATYVGDLNHALRQYGKGLKRLELDYGNTIWEFIESTCLGRTIHNHLQQIEVLRISLAMLTTSEEHALVDSLPGDLKALWTITSDPFNEQSHAHMVERLLNTPHEKRPGVLDVVLVDGAGTDSLWQFDAGVFQGGAHVQRHVCV